MPLVKLHNPLEDCELKFAGDDSGQGTFEGYASTFNKTDVDNDTILPGAFADTLKKDPRPLMLFSHMRESVIGIWVSLKEDKKGLRVKGEMTPGNTESANVYASLKHGALSGLSIGFRIPKGGAQNKPEDDNFFPGRIIKRVQLVEVSVVAMPADKGAQISGVKAEIEAIESIREAELFLRDSEFSKSMAVAFVNRVNALARRDAAKAYQDEINELKARLDQRWTAQRNASGLVNLINRM